MNRAIQWLKYASLIVGSYKSLIIVICLLKESTGTVPCPDEFGCTGAGCYLLYPEDRKWKYKAPNGGDTHTTSHTLYNNPNCYTYIQVSNENRSCIDAQRECEDMVGGNIKVINSVDEYNQLTYIALRFLDKGFSSRFNVHLESDIHKKNLVTGCVIVDVYDGEENNNIITSENKDCSTTDMVNAIICESTDKTEICSAPSQTTKPNISENKSSAGVVVAICVPLVVIIMILLIVLFFFRRKKKKRRMSSDNKHSIGKGNSHSNDIYVPAHSDDYAEIAAPAETLSDPVRYTDTTNAQQHCKYAALSPSSPAAKPTNVAVGLCALPNKKKRIDQDFSDTYDTLNASDMTPDTKTDITGDVNTEELSNDAAMSPLSPAAKPNNVAVGLYALPNKKKRIDRDFSDTYDTLNASDMTPDTKTDIGDVSYANTEGLSNGDELYNCINAAEVKSDKEVHIQDVPYENTTGTYANSTNMQSPTGTHSDETHDGDVYSSANEEAQNNEYGKLKTDTPLKTDNMYTYVDMPINSTMSSPEDSTYDRLQRNK